MSTNTKSRLAKLESATNTHNSVDAIFLVGFDEIPKGFICDGVTIYRQFGESEESFKDRCLYSFDHSKNKKIPLLVSIGAEECH